MTPAAAIIIGNIWIVGSILCEGPLALRIAMFVWGIMHGISGLIWSAQERRA